MQSSSIERRRSRGGVVRAVLAVLVLSAAGPARSDEAGAKVSEGEASFRLHRQDAVALDGHEPSAAYRWVDVMLEAAARDVERIGARPTILSRQMAIPVTAMFDAWAAYDDRAVGTVWGGSLRRPEGERVRENVETAIAHAMCRTLVDQYPHFAEYVRDAMRSMGYDPDDTSEDPTTPVGIGNLVARTLLEQRYRDGSNQLGDEIGSSGEPYSDYTMYRPVNPTDRVLDPDRWQPLPFADGDGGFFYPDFLTPHWYRVKPFALQSGDQFRPGPPPLVGSEQLRREVDELIEMNASLTVEQKALVEFMRDGPRSTGQSGHWMRFAQDVSRRDAHDLSQDVRLFFAVGNVCFDAFIASWDSKRFYDSSRPWTLVRHLYAGETIRGWAGPGKGVREIPAEQWHPYSPATFVTPPFPGYTSGHSTVSAAAAKMLELFTGSDRFMVVEKRRAGSMTEPGFACEMMQQVDGALAAMAHGQELSCDVRLRLPTFSETADLAGISRVLGGYHIQADNVEGLRLGRKVAEHSWPIVQRYLDGTAEIER
jgi:hypothetical protein